MAADFSIRTNDRTALKIAERLATRFPQGTLSPDSFGNLCAYLYEYAGLDYSETMSLIHRIKFTGSQPDILRLSYALIHYEQVNGFGNRGKYTAHARVLKVTADKIKTPNPRLCLQLLLLSSRYAGCILNYEVSLRDAVKIQRSIYSGRSKALAGRSLLEFVGCVCTVHVIGDLPQSLSASVEEKKLNKQLCTARAKADTECQKAPTCVQCRERRATCRLAVRH